MFWSRNNPTGHAIDVDYTPTKGGRTNIDFFIKRDVRFDDTIESFRYTFFLDNRNLQTARKHVTNVQRSGYTSAVHVFPAGTACWGKWTTASFLCKFYLTNPRWGCKLILLHVCCSRITTFLNWTLKNMSIFGKYVWTIENQWRLSTSTKYERHSKYSLTC